jgi:hypothetical protein
MIDTILFMGKFATALGALEGVLLTTLVLEVAIEVVVPVVGPLTMGTRIDTFGPVSVFGHRFAAFPLGQSSPGPTRPLFRGAVGRRAGLNFSLFELGGHEHGVRVGGGRLEG